MEVKCHTRGLRLYGKYEVEEMHMPSNISHFKQLDRQCAVSSCGQVGRARQREKMRSRAQPNFLFALRREREGRLSILMKKERQQETGLRVAGREPCEIVLPRKHSARL